MSKWTKEKLPETFVFKVLYKEDEDVPEDYNEGQLFKAVSVSYAVEYTLFVVLWADGDRLEGYNSVNYDVDEVLNWLNDGSWEIVEEVA